MVGQDKRKGIYCVIPTLALCLLWLVLVEPVFASGDYDLDAVWKDLDAVQAWAYQVGKYRKADSLLAGVREKVENRLRISVWTTLRMSRRQITILDSLIKDAKGYYDRYPTFRGKIIEARGNYAGYFVVRDEKEDEHSSMIVD